MGTRVRRIFVKSVDDSCSTMPLVLGLVNYFKRQLPAVGYFRPVYPHTSRHVEIIREVAGIPDAVEDMFGVTEEDGFQVCCLTEVGVCVQVWVELEIAKSKLET